jgi:cytochrome c553
MGEHTFVARARPEPPIPLVENSGRPPDPRRTKPVELRHCRHHGDTEFGLYGIRRPQWRCKRCICEAVTRRHQRLKEILVDQAGACCCICGYRRTVINLHFHHVEPSQKSFNMTMARGKSLASYQAEAEKCVLVCANCHGEIEAGIIESPPPGSVFPALVSPGRRSRHSARQNAQLKLASIP